MKNRKFVTCIAIALLIKTVLFLFTATEVPDMKMQADSHSYLDSSLAFFPEGVFGKTHPEGTFGFEYYRTPGYPLFLGIFHDLLKIPLNGIIILQILLTICSAIIVYKAANIVDPRLGIVAFFIILLDPAITVHSLMLLTESLYLLLMSIFLFMMIKYLQARSKKHLLSAALILVAATYVRPISFYLGALSALFIFCISVRKDVKKSIIHTGIFIITVYSLLFCWQWRNYNHFKQLRFSNINNATVNLKGLYKSYGRNEDPYSQDLPPLLYYVNVGSRNLMSLMTRPVSFKYFGSTTLKRAGKLISYPWIAFWLFGLIVGACKAGKYVPYHFLLIVILYFTVVTIGGAMWGAGARFRIPMMPFIAIISSYGWTHLYKR